MFNYILIASLIIIGLFSIATALIRPKETNVIPISNTVNIANETSIIRYVLDTQLPNTYTTDTQHDKLAMTLNAQQLEVLTDWEFYTFYKTENTSPYHIAVSSKTLPSTTHLSTIEYLDSQLIAQDPLGNIIYLPDTVLSLEGGTVLWEKQ